MRFIWIDKGEVKKCPLNLYFSAVFIENELFLNAQHVTHERWKGKHKAQTRTWAKEAFDALFLLSLPSASSPD